MPHYLQNLFQKVLISSLLSFFCMDLIVGSVNGQTTGKSQVLFQSDDIIQFELRANFTKIFKDRNDSTRYHKAVLSYIKPDGDTVFLDVRVKVRGMFRKNPKNCEFPPLWVNFKKEEVIGTIFEDQKKLKLVTLCQLERYILQEYIIYKLYNQITDLSYRVRLIKINYFTTDKNKSLYDGYSFFIENVDLMAERNNMIVTEKFFTPYRVDRNTMLNLGLFEYMIGNNDWYVTSHQNITLIASDSIKTPFPVPYDFDMSELIDPNYRKPKGVPEEELVSTQVYMGICMTPEEQRKSFQYFEIMKEKFNETILKDKYLSKTVKNEVIKFLKRFYNIIEDPESVKTEINLKCFKYQDFHIPQEK